MEPSDRLTAHIINHTHWDREWFLTSTYTTPWIPGLIDRLGELVEGNPDFRYFLDGQTLVIEDLLQAAPHYRGKVERLVRGGNLAVGPYYCQPDWRLTGGEALVRNLLHGRRDMQQYGGRTDAGWLVDTFGHISQAPQLHRLFGIGSVYLWRGAPRLEPYVRWQGADGTELFTIHVLGGYRNLYGVTQAPELAVLRLENEIHKLQPFYPTPDIPLFDGYDLENHPEDPVQLYLARREELPPGIQIQETTPDRFAHLLRRKLRDLPAWSGELNSGKYAAVFPGTLSARTYLKVLARDCEHLLYQVCEPLGALACLHGRTYPARQYERWSRLLLQNAVHDCLCGVSIDLVHEKMEHTYRQVFEDLQADLQTSLGHIFEDFASGSYALSTNPFPYQGWQPVDSSLYHVKTQGTGAWETEVCCPIRKLQRPVDEFAWKNACYEARIHPGGRVQVGEAVLGVLAVREEHGDTYSEETGALLGALQPDAPMVVEQESDLHAVLCISLSAAWGNIRVSAVVRLTFDPSPLIRWQIDLDSTGTDFRVDLVFETGQPGPVAAGMPFDVVRRPAADQDWLSRPLEDGLAAVLMGQREIGVVETFPFHDFVAMSNGSRTAGVLAKGEHAYQADGKGRLQVTLRRAVEWLAKPGLASREGDAGPFFYVPGARSERTVTHELAFVLAGFGVDDPRFHALNAGYQNPPLLVQTQTGGARTGWDFFQENLPVSSLQIANSRLLVRVYNPTARPHTLSRTYLQTDVFGNPEGMVQEVPAKGIRTLAVAAAELTAVLPPAQPASRAVRLLNPPAWRVGPDRGVPDPAVIQGLEERVSQLEGQIEEATARLNRASGAERYPWQHQIYVFQRELYEHRLSIRLNQIKQMNPGQATSASLYTPDEAVAEIGQKLNQLRIQRRIYDYIVQIFC